MFACDETKTQKQSRRAEKRQEISFREKHFKVSIIILYFCRSREKTFLAPRPSA